MDDVWFGPGLTRDDLESFLDALALHDKRLPLLAVAGGDQPTLVMASHGFFRLFDVTTDQALSDRLLGGTDPGAKRLGILFHTLATDSAPRLERLRFLVGLGSEIITFLCRSVTAKDGRRVFVAAALGVRPGLIPEAVLGQGVPGKTSPEPAPQAPVPAAPVALAAAPLAAVVSPTPEPVPLALDVKAIQATLRNRYPSSRTVRFLWQSDGDMICTQVTPPLADVVGLANADLVGRDLLDIAGDIDPSGALGDALQRRETWSGLDVAWPITDAAAAVEVGLGAIPSFTRERIFDGYRGYGVIRLDRIVTRAALHLPARGEIAPRPLPADNIVPFPGAKALSPEDQIAFAALGTELRDQAGIVVAPPEPEPAKSEPVVPEPATSAPPVHEPAITDGVPDAVATDPEPAPAPIDMVALASPAVAAAVVAPPAVPATPEAIAAADGSRRDTVARNGLAMLDRLATGVLVSRDNIPIFANRHLLDLLGFADEDALHEAGGMAHLFGNQPGNTTGAASIGVRGRDGTIIPANARMQSIEWDGLPATLLTLAQAPSRPDTTPAERTALAELLAPAEPMPAAAMDVAQIAAVQGQIEEAQRRHEATLADVRREHEETRQRDDGELRELRAILETATDGVAVIDAHCNVVSLNRSGEALFGHDRGAVIGKPFTNLFAPHNQGLAADYFDGIKSNATKSLLNDGREFVVKAHQGTIPVFMTLGRLPPAAATEETRFCALFRDLTHWKKVEQDLDSARLEAERSSALKTDFLAKVSHEIRTPLNAIIGFAEVIVEERFGPVGNERYKDYLRDIHASGTHVMSLVDDLLDLSKIEAGKMELASDVVDANKVIGECVSLMQPQASRERVIMRLSLAPTLPRIKADERSLRQIVLNLLSNAVKFNEAGGQVIVATTTTESGQVVIRIRDTGPGMSETDIKAALEPFRQLSTSRPMVGGTGLGLPLTKALVEANEAAFTIRSKVDQGTLVEVAFPPARVLAD